MPMRHDFSENLMSLQSHILLEEAKHPSASGDFTWIVSAISLAAKSISNHVRRARLSGAIGKFGDTNVQGEEQQKLDVIANEALMRCLGTRASVAVLASEEDDEPTEHVVESIEGLLEISASEIELIDDPRATNVHDARGKPIPRPRLIKEPEGRGLREAEAEAVMVPGPPPPPPPARVLTPSQLRRSPPPSPPLE